MAPVARGLLCGAAALQAALCVAWTAANLGDVPHYGDSVEYLVLAERGRVDEYRGFLYPALLRAAGSALGARPWSLDFEDRSQAARGRCAAPGALAAVQGAQLGLCAALLAYFLYVLLPGLAPRGTGRRARAGVLGILLVLLLSDPLVTHFQASVMTDGLALAGSLAFCAALADARVGRTPAWLAMLLLFASTVLVAGLRVEKTAVLAATGAASVALGAVWRRRDVPGAGRREALRIALPLAAGLALALAAQQASTASQGRWPRATAIRHERIVFQNLRAVYPQLPERVRRVLSREQARLYDRRIARVRDVMTEISGGDPARLESLTRDMTAVVLRERWPRVLLDVATDAAENLAATVSFYARVLAWQVLGDARYFAWSRSEGTRWTYEMLALHHPRLSAAYVASGALLFLVASGLALGRARVALGRARARRRTGRGGRRAGAWLPFAPLACFCALNAALFATAADLVHIRYALPSHVALLTLVYAAALRGVRGDVAPDSRFPRDAADDRPKSRETGIGSNVPLFAAAVAFAGCAPNAPPDLVLLSVDTLRPDHLGLYGYHRETSPELSRWFADAAVFERAYAPEASTPPSVVSLLSGRLPQHHGVRLFYQLVPEQTRLLPDLLPPAYQSAAVVSNVVLTDRALGIGGRFQHYDDLVDREVAARLFERDARRTSEAALAWLARGRAPGRRSCSGSTTSTPTAPIARPPTPRAPSPTRARCRWRRSACTPTSASRGPGTPSTTSIATTRRSPTWTQPSAG